MSGITVQLDTMPAPVMAAHCRGLFEAIGSFFDDPDNQVRGMAQEEIRLLAERYFIRQAVRGERSVNNEQAEKEARRRSFPV